MDASGPGATLREGPFGAVEEAVLKIYPGAPQGVTVTHQDEFNRDLSEFIETGTVRQVEEQPALRELPWVGSSDSPWELLPTRAFEAGYKLYP